MNVNRFEVVYVDKIIDIAEADIVRDNLRTQFGLSNHALNRLHSGFPVVIKKLISLPLAKKLRKKVIDAGGTCWIQELSTDGEHFERRQAYRRSPGGRRKEYRASAILPDRRCNRDRRCAV